MYIVIYSRDETVALIVTAIVTIEEYWELPGRVRLTDEAVFCSLI